MITTTPSASAFAASHRPSIVAGIGCRRGADAAEIIALVTASLSAVGLDASSLVAIATLDRKADEPGLLAAAAHFGVPLRAFAAPQLALAQPSGSAKIQDFVGTPSVAEAAAGQAGPLVLPKRRSVHATCALAATGPGFDLAAFGQTLAGSAPFSTASTAASRSLTSNAGP